MASDPLTDPRVTCTVCGAECRDQLTPEERMDPDRVCDRCWRRMETEIRAEFLKLLDTAAKVIKGRRPPEAP